ncbi:DUF4270 domain-containing protein [Mucilaginibacter sp. ZT4R22]|uniref:DUF4270 domain-containing protein n=1 Tax=Mucilaginibacter pankratovii TaxID=2772110 RepID=A0ABR7WML4_9SPHI|nr:DUF4270 domain-containing protein [Mucilaginibacter pankratovii]MBD1363535.1 DUF4270 domain-containing protein [Mucilaginibacter pankratovii]
MKFYKLGLLTLLISLFILSSCKNQDGIGLGVDAGNQLNGTLLADTNIVVTNVLEDSVVTSALFRTPLSYFKDPEFGVTESNIAAQLTLPGGVAYTLPTGTISIDSVLLVLPYASSGFYGDSLTSKYKINVHQLNEKYVSQTYYNIKQWDYSPTLLGTKTFTARSHDTIKIVDVVKGGNDTLKKVSPQIRIPINPDFIGGGNFFEGPTTVRSSTLAFQNNIKGIYLTLDKAGTTGPGGNLMLSMDSARIAVYFKANNAGVIDTTLISLPVSTGSHMASIKHTYSAKVQASLNKTSTDGLIYLQGLAGLRAKVEFPNIKSTFASVGGDVIINRAELVIKAAPGTTVPFAALSRLTMYQLDLAKQRIRIQDASTSDPRGVNGPSFFSGFYNKANGEYHFLVTAYIQDLVRGKTVDYGTYIAPVDPTLATLININPTATYAERTITPAKNSPSRIKLNIIYTKINQ